MKHLTLLCAIGFMAFVCGGCQPMVWYRPGTSLEQMRMDYAQAQLDAQRSVRPSNTVIVANNSREAATDAAIAGLADGISMAIQQSQMIDAEMRSKGYILVPAEPPNSTEARAASYEVRPAPPAPTDTHYGWTPSGGYIPAPDYNPYNNPPPYNYNSPQRNAP